MTNPQNTQYFGSKNPYPLEISEVHRFLIPNVDNEVDSTDLEMWVGDYQIYCQFGIASDKLFRVTISSDELVSGQIQIRKSTGEVLFYSNCVQFIDSTDPDGRKFIRVATKHYYNRNLFDYGNGEFEWMVTNLPAYDFGQFAIESEYNTDRSGESNSLLIQDSYIDEVVSYQFIGDGDSNIFSFIQAHVLNTEFYIDGTKRTIKEQPEIDEFSMMGIIKFVNQKDKNGLNILLDESLIFEDVIVFILGNNEKTQIYTHPDGKTIIQTE
jgi:hypothetical protein